MTPYQREQMRTRLLSYLTVDGVLKDEEEDEIIAYEGGYEDHIEDAQCLFDALKWCLVGVENSVKLGHPTSSLSRFKEKAKQALDKYLNGE